AVDDNKQFRNRLYLGPEYAYQYLTRRELSVLKQLITGKTFSKISSILNISSRTVEKHAENIKLKLQCDSQCQLGYLAAKLKLDEH
ncbi:MAG: helix-turn-helix transcriptional regulator, partial [Gammaproteobacteria bacterium]|nr:helix-turn-helix transcriptional regulator [Gammaproteobacteria bacterium]